MNSDKVSMTDRIVMKLQNNWPPSTTMCDAYEWSETAKWEGEKVTNLWSKNRCDSIWTKSQSHKNAHAHAWTRDSRPCGRVWTVCCGRIAKVKNGRDNTLRKHRKSSCLFKRSANSNGATERTAAAVAVERVTTLSTRRRGYSSSSDGVCKSSKLLICWENENVNRWSRSDRVCVRVGELMYLMFGGAHECSYNKTYFQ